MMRKDRTKSVRPKVSIIMPAYNAERFIESAICSVQRQTLSDWELIVLDDGSKDSTCSIVERLAEEDQRIVFVRNEANMGVAKTRNRGLDRCNGEYVALLDSDDVWHPEKLEEQLAALKRNNADMAYCSYAIVNATGEKVKRDYIVPEIIKLSDLIKENVIGCSTILMTRRIASEYRFETDFYHEDYVLWLQLLQDGYKAVGCTRVLVDWRYIENSRSFDKRKSAGNRWKIYRGYLQLSLWKSALAFIWYTVAGLKKYLLT